ncbi:CheA signal transduction histidine kinase [Geobacter metallireducens RCH3]|uniref:histidine kinase n=1 Tax=Geobacter metallireducens (strain ATCC 53774 / DSM 7210 / GS-15) TaxID=269799 RepID=Q39T88_GEOMG|nr:MULTISPECIES: chemotaxis protein CheA [Geobacter]ABB32536.1 sensor histidine kinase CheA associated with MCPs of class 40H [Geobacter metallireducens GS-15]EHP86437.1 CheA signal transduction histidine kinase [Geobacter metallireducens RCH3]MBT1076019.1 chemotaxis protein CheA [Geobacter grbiciae]
MANSNDTSGRAVEDFLAEAEEIVDRLSTDLGTLGDCADSGECDPDLLNAIFRGAHSLKGLAGMFGFADIQQLSHNLENLLDSLRLGKIPLTNATMNILFDAMELLGSVVRGLGTGENFSSAIADAIQRLNDCATAQESGGESPLQKLGLPEKVLNSLTEYEEHRLLENVKKGRTIYSIHASFNLMSFDQDLGEITEVLKKSGEVVSTLPSASATPESMIDFEILYGTDLALDDVTGLIDRDNVEVTRIGAAASPPSAIAAGVAVAIPATAQASVPTSAPAEVSAPVGQGDDMTAKSMSRTVRVDIGKLDDLMNIVGELVLSHSIISMLATRMRLEGFSSLAIELGKAAKGLDRKLTELQKGVMEIRMIPVGQLFEKMARIVRKVSREQGKKVDLKTFGADTELDKLIIEDIADPMVHIIRNAIDHGLETTEERVAAGKPERGTIRLSSYQKGNHVVIEVSDDGHGFNIEKVKKKALEKGLIKTLEGVSDREALDFIFLPGFSTADKVSELSGRGVGMDVVKNNIAAVSGMVDIESIFGQGSKVIITLPITLAIIKALLVSTAGRTYALPITSVLETIIVTENDIDTVERKEVYQLRQTTLPLVRLERFFGVPRTKPDSAEFYVVVVGVAEKRLGVIVDDLMGQQDIVIKSLGDMFKGYRGITGAADLGDQRTILVLDVGGIIGEAFRSGG